MHPQVGDQRTRAHKHGRALGQQGVAQHTRFDLDDVVTLLRQRHANHLGGLRFFAGELGQVSAACADAGVVFEQGHFARVDAPVAFDGFDLAVVVGFALDLCPLVGRAAKLFGAQLALVPTL